MEPGILKQDLIEIARVEAGTVGFGVHSCHKATQTDPVYSEEHTNWFGECLYAGKNYPPPLARQPAMRLVLTGSDETSDFKPVEPANDSTNQQQFIVL